MYDFNCVENANQHVSTQGKIPGYSYEMGSVGGFFLKKMKLISKRVDSVKAKSSQKFDRLLYHRVLPGCFILLLNPCKCLYPSYIDRLSAMHFNVELR